MASVFKNSIENMYKRMITYSILAAIITIAAGLVLLFLPNLTNKVVGIIAGAIFLIEGINSIYKYFHREGAKLYNLSLIFGVLYSILGVVIIKNAPANFVRVKLANGLNITRTPTIATRIPVANVINHDSSFPLFNHNA